MSEVRWNDLYAVLGYLWLHATIASMPFSPLSLPLSIFLLFSFLSLPFPSNGSSFTASHKSTRHYRIMRISTADIRTREVFWSVRMVLFFEIVCFCFLYIWKARNLIREKLIVKHEELCNRGNFALEEINVSNGLQIFLFFNILECFSLYIFFFFFFNLQKWFEVISKYRISFKFFLFFDVKMSFSLFFYDRWIYFSIILR